MVRLLTDAEWQEKHGGNPFSARSMIEQILSKAAIIPLQEGDLPSLQEAITPKANQGRIPEELRRRVQEKNKQRVKAAVQRHKERKQAKAESTSPVSIKRYSENSLENIKKALTGRVHALRDGVIHGQPISEAIEKLEQILDDIYPARFSKEDEMRSALGKNCPEKITTDDDFVFAAAVSESHCANLQLACYYVKDTPRVRTVFGQGELEKFLSNADLTQEYKTEILDAWLEALITD